MSKPLREKLIQKRQTDAVHDEAHLENAYRSIMLLLPESWPSSPFVERGPFSLELIEASRYTWQIRLRYAHPQLPAQMDVRVYLDLKMAEPISYQGVQVKTTMGGQHDDEKRQMLSFLQYWLDLIENLSE